MSAFDPSRHPRGGPGNPGRFAPGDSQRLPSGQVLDADDEHAPKPPSPAQVAGLRATMAQQRAVQKAREAERRLAESSNTAGRMVFHTSPQPFHVLMEVDPELAQLLMDKRAERLSLHAATERTNRLAVANPGNVWRSFLVDRETGRGNEVHVLTDNAEVYVYSLGDGRLITMLNARPGQLTRYVARDDRIPDEMMECARANVRSARNDIA